MNRAERLTIAVTGAALFMVVLDNLIVASTLPAIQRSLGASLGSLEWVLNAYILAFAVLMLSAAALGERYGRRRVFTAGVLLFTVASAAGALAPNAGTLIAARALEGIGGAAIMPLTLTMMTAAFPAERRGAALGIWAAISGFGVALGPVAGGLLTGALSWHWIFWVNVPIGVAVAVGARVLAEGRGAAERRRHRRLVLASAGLLGIVYATVRGNTAGWGSASTLVAYAAGAVLLGGVPVVGAPLRPPDGAAAPVPLERVLDRERRQLPARVRDVLRLPDADPVLRARRRGPADDRRPHAVLDRHADAGRSVRRAARAARPRGPGRGGGAGARRDRHARDGAARGPGRRLLALAPAMVAIGVGIGFVIPNVAAAALAAVPAPTSARPRASSARRARSAASPASRWASRSTRRPGTCPPCSSRPPRPPPSERRSRACAPRRCCGSSLLPRRALVGSLGRGREAQGTRWPWFLLGAVLMIVGFIVHGGILDRCCAPPRCSWSSAAASAWSG